jgi:hypothetical protein
MPATQSTTDRFYVARADIYRLIEQRDQPPVLDPEDYEDFSQLVGFLDRDTMEAQAKTLGRLEFADSLNLTSPADLAQIRIRYAVRYVNSRSQTAPFSNSVAVEPVALIARPPSNLQVSTTLQDSVSLSWSAPEANVDGSSPAAVIGYNVYRRRAAVAARTTLLNANPVGQTNFVDDQFEYTVNYVYFVRALSQGTEGLIESADSATATITPLDTFKPAPPDPLSVASANGVISLFWPTNRETDVAGYNIYRAESAGAPDQDWLKMNAQLHTLTTYRDEKVIVDRRYHYRVTAVDRFGNESAASKVASETAHP